VTKARQASPAEVRAEWTGSNAAVLLELTLYDAAIISKLDPPSPVIVSWQGKSTGPSGKLTAVL
jgi:hypothetical protein